ncbi:hypothetical protein IFM89_002990 [Coptis chinensis]|uniref:Uncharacterized protein n=1 Tax=Coptis chinensis TaxID=261450 RepID=A0A835ITK2_9MAGN|nr:hypothetical protein IFM89_002990 [Coptis chinensis]
MKSMLNDVNRLHCKHRCLVGYGGGSVGLIELQSPIPMDIEYLECSHWLMKFIASCTPLLGIT